MGTGKKIRWSRFLDQETGRGIILPIDHGLTMGPIEGIASVRQVSRVVGHSAINGVIAHKGMLERLGAAGMLGGGGVMMHLNGMSASGEIPDTKQRLTSVETALRLGADAVSVQVNFCSDNHAHNMTLLGTVVDEALKYDLPVFAMVYDKAPAQEKTEKLKRIRHYIRLAYELGVDAVKTDAPDDLDDLPCILNDLAEDVAIFFSGGALTNEERILSLARAIVRNGGAGLCVGRNVFQRPDPASLLTQLRKIL